MSATPAALLFGTADIDKSFRLSDDGQSGDLAWVVAVPTIKDAGFERLRIAMRGGLPARMEVDDAFGQRTRFEFDAIDPKAPVPAAQFRFTPPPGVDVVR
jgi:outer membrane lipoprotein carrier protein